MNIYIFAPKDDPYHNSQWREPYPKKELADIQSMVEAGAASKCRFAWAIHPFMNDAITLADYDAGLEAIQIKFQQLYDAGVRQFVISADDADSPVTLQAKLCKDMTEWVKSHEGTYNLVFVPQVYCTNALTWSDWGWSGSPSLEQYFGHFSDIEDLEIMWTGEWVCYPASQDTMTNFKNKTGKEAFMWLNWPVNDVNHSRLVMGPAESGILEPGMTDFMGIVTNPLEQAEASKTALFAIADFAWNTTDFSCFESWEAGFKYIEPGASEAMHELCKHLTNPSPGGITSMGESTELTPYITAFTDAYDNGNGTDYAEEAAGLIEQLQKIAAAADAFQTNGINVNLQDEMKPWVDSLRYLSKACISYIKAAIAFDENDENEFCSNYLSAVNNYKASQNCESPILEGTQMVEAGAMHIMPFAEALDTSLSEEAVEIFGNGFGGNDTSEEATVIYDGIGGLYEGTINKITDGNDSTYAWFDENAAANAYIGLDLGDVYKLDTIRILQGTNETNEDIFSSSVLEYSLDNQNWIPIGNYTGNNIEEYVLDQDLQARYVRLRTPSATEKWFAIREFTVTTQMLNDVVYTNVEDYQDQIVTITKDSASVTDVETIVLQTGEYIGIDFSFAKKIISLTADYTNKDKLTLEYSYNGFEWYPVEQSFESIDARYIRIINQSNVAVTFSLNELSVQNTSENRSVYSNPDGKQGYEAAKALDNSITTAFAAEEGSGSLIWRLTAQTVDELYIMQDMDYISNADVYVRAYTKAWFKIGTLSQSWNMFNNLAGYGPINEVKVEWKQNGPMIYEIYIRSQEHTDSEVLEALVNTALEELPESSIYTKESYEKFSAALAWAKSVLSKADATEEEIKEALYALYLEAGSLKLAEQETDETPLKPMIPDELETPNTKPSVNTVKSGASLKVGDTATVGKLKYRVTNAEAKEVAVYGVTSKSMKKVTIPASVKVKDETYKVTSIANKAFSGMKKLKSAVIGANVKTIGAKAFFNDKKLNKITIKSKSLTKVAKNALKNTKKSGMIKVPKGKKKAYAKLFKNIGNKKIK